MPTDSIIVLIALGGVGGLVAGRWWAEVMRARHDMRKAWKSRKDYRS